MSLGDKVVLMCVIFLSYKVVMTGCEVVLVHRNVTDSFRVGKNGCTSDSKVCPSSSTCQPYSGLCLCGNLPNFRNPVVENVNGYKCVRSEDVRQGLDGFGKVYCGFEPFRLIPYSHNEAATQFRQTNQMTSCSLDTSKKPQAKFPNITNNMELKWLDDSYVQFSVSNNVLSFKWKRSVPELQGAIITLYSRCKQGDSYTTTCLRAKVFGTWPPDQNPTEPASVSTRELPPAPTVHTTTKARAKPSFTETTEPNTPRAKSATDYVNPSVSTARPSTSSVYPSPPGEVSGNDSGSIGTITIVAAVVPVVLLIIMFGVLWWVCKRRRENKERSSCRGRPSRKKDIAEKKELTQKGIRNGTKSSFAAQSNYGYLAAGDQCVIAEANPTYDGTPNTARKQAIEDSPYPTEPGYDTPHLKGIQALTENKKEEVASHYYARLENDVKGKEDDAQYSTPDIERVNVNGDMYSLPNKKKENEKKEVPAHYYSTPDNSVKGKKDDAQYSTRDIERVNVNGYMYALPNKKKENDKKEVAAHYCSTPDNSVKSKEDTAKYSTPDIERVEVNGDMYALPNKSEKNKKGKHLNYLDSSLLYSDTQDKSKSSAQSDESTLYAEIDEAMRPPQKEKK